MKKHLSLLLCLLMLVSTFSVFTVQSSAAAAPMIWDFTDFNSVAKSINSVGGVGCNDLYIGAFRNSEGASPYSGTVAYDANEKAVVLGTTGNGAEYAHYRTYMISKKTSFNPADYPYLKLRFKVESNLTNMTMKLRNTGVSNSWPGIDLYTNNLPTGEWVEVVFNVGGDNAWAKSGTVKAATSGPNNALNVSWSLQILPASGKFKDGDFTLKLQYAGFFATEAEAEAYPADPVIIALDHPAASTLTGSTAPKAATRNFVYAAGLGGNSNYGKASVDNEENTLVFTTKPATSNKNLYRLTFYVRDEFAVADRPYMVVRYKLNTDAATVNARFRSSGWSNVWLNNPEAPSASAAQNPIKTNEWVTEVIDLTKTGWKTLSFDGQVYTDSSESALKTSGVTSMFYLQFEGPSGYDFGSDPNYALRVQYVGFFATKGEAENYTYTPEPKKDPIVWRFDNYNVLPAYVTNTTDAYVSSTTTGGKAAIADYDRDAQALTVTPDYAVASSSTSEQGIMRVIFNNKANTFQGKDYPYVKVGYKLVSDNDDYYRIYLRNSAWSMHFVTNMSTPINQWNDTVINMAAAHPSWDTHAGWVNATVGPNSSHSLLFQIEDLDTGSAKNIFNNKDFQFQLRYIAFFATEEEANAFTFTPAPAPETRPTLEIKLDNPNASDTLVADTANLTEIFADNFVIGGQATNGAWPIGIMGYDNEEQSLYFTTDKSQRNITFPTDYAARIYLKSQNSTVKAENYRYAQIRYKLVSDTTDPKANIRVFLRDGAWGSYDLFADKKTPVNEWVTVTVDLWAAGKDWASKTIVSPSANFYIQFQHNDERSFFDDEDFRVYVQYLTFFSTEEEANAYTYVPTDMDSLPNADDYKPTEKAIVMPFDLPKYSYALGGNRYSTIYAIQSVAFGADNNGVTKYDEKEQALYIEALESLASVTHSRFVIRGAHQFSGADYPYVKLCYKITNYEFGVNDYLSFRNGSAWSTIQLSEDELKADEWVTITANLNAMPGGSTWKNTLIGGTYGDSSGDLRLQLYLNKTTGDNFTTNPDTRFYLKYIAFFQTQADAEAFDFAEWNKPAEEETNITADLWLKVLARKYAEKYVLSASCTEGGIITDIGDTQVKYKKDMTYTITAAEGYTLTDVLVDGKSVGAVTEYTFDDVKKAHTIHAVFTANAVEEGK